VTIEVDFKAILIKKVKSLNTTAKAYRKRYRRHPPPSFKEWYNFTIKYSVFVVKDFFNQIYNDLNLF
jgi:hypothetical protein